MKKTVKGFRILFVMAVVLLVAALPQTVSAKVKVKKVTVKSNYGSSVHVAVGKKVKLTTTVKVTPNKAANKKVKYKSSKKKIATVSSSGYVKGIKTGKCKITVTSKKNKKKKAKITVKVVKKVTSVSIAEPKAPLYVGNSVTLKATVKPSSGSYKKVKWSTSDKKVATVSSAGVVKGKKAGTVTIKATSVEGSKKSASIKLKVLATNSVNISSLEVLSTKAVRVVLDKACQLTANQIVLQGKKYSFGSYIKGYKIAQLRNYDNTTYDLTLSDEQTINKDSYVRIAIDALPGNGTKSMETQALMVKDLNITTARWIGSVGDMWDKVVDLSDYCCGDITYVVTGSIPGIECKIRNNEVHFTGQLTTVLVKSRITIKATDEVGNTIQVAIDVSVGNESSIVAYADETTVLNEEQTKIDSFIVASGGSGNYQYSAISLPSGMQVDEETGALYGTPTRVGTYTVKYTVTDKGNSAISYQGTVKVSVADRKRVIGTVVDKNGKAVSGATINCENVSTGMEYSTKTGADGSYTIYIGEGSYDITATYGDGTDGVYRIAVGAGGKQIHFVLSE